MSKKVIDITEIYNHAETQCPPDIVEYGLNHRLENFAKATWINGYVQGYRDAKNDATRINKTNS